MKKSLYILLLYLGCQFVLYACFLLGYAAVAPDHAIHYDLFARRPVMMGYYLLVTDVVLFGLLCRLRLVRWPLCPPKGVRPPLRSGVWGVTGVVLCCIGISTFTSMLQLSDGGTTAQFKQMTDNPVCLITLCLIGPLVEEVVFREGILRKLAESGTAAWAAIGASAVLFSVAHNNPVQSVAAFITGILLGVLYVGVGDMRLSAMAHVINNVLAATLLISGMSGGTVLPAPSQGQLAALGTGCMAAGLLLMIIWWRRRTPYSFLSDCRKSPDYL